MRYSVFDIETDGLIENVTKIHCLCYVTYDDIQKPEFGTLTNLQEIKEWVESQGVLVGHNIKRYDIPVIKKLLPGVDIKARVIDTIALSWYLYPFRPTHNLEDWGTDVGVEKPPILDWTGLTAEEYIHRCTSDVKINDRLFDIQTNYLFLLYDNKDKVDRLVNYLMFKMDCAAEQEEVKWRLDKEKAEKNLAFFNEELQKKTSVLISVMPEVIKYKDVCRPKEIYKKLPKPTKKNPDPKPELSVAGEKWLSLLKERGLPDYHVGTLQVETGREPGNPGSHQQLKNWLFSLGWIPETFDYKKKDPRDPKSIRAIPQISKKEGGICDSITKMYEEHPELESLEGVFVLRHRISIMEGFLRNVDKDGFLIAAVNGFTNTLRFQHTIIVNLPTIPKPYWEEVRGCLIAPDSDHVLCGSDMSGLEDNTKRHYMYYYDPKYVEEMMEYGFDSHCDIAVLAKKMSLDEQTFYKWYTAKKENGDPQRILDDYYNKEINPSIRVANSATGWCLEKLLEMDDKEQAAQIKILKPIRLKNKKVNFAAVYGAGGPKIALTASIPLSEAKLLHGIYWQRNWSVKKVADSCVTKMVNGQMWLLNPVSQFWYSLREEKDKFSTLNQGTGVYAFDTWIRNVRKQGIKICGQFHDEHIAPIKKGTELQHREKLLNAIKWTNDELQLNVILGISIDFGHSYADIH